MEKETTSSRLKKIMAERGLRQTDVVALAQPFCRHYNISLQKSALSQYVSGKVEPSQDKLFILGQVLDVNEAWLMGYDVPMDKGSELTYYGSEPGDSFAHLCWRMSQMSDEKQDFTSKWFLKQLDDVATEPLPNDPAAFLTEKRQAALEIIEKLSDDQIDAILKLLGE